MRSELFTLIDFQIGRPAKRSESSAFPLSARISGRLQDVRGKYVERWWKLSQGQSKRAGAAWI
jgi:hypothetical protein